LRAYQKILPEIKDLGASLVAISPQLPDKSLSMVEKNELSFEVLSDLGNSVARQYGLVFKLNEQLLSLYKKFGIDLPEHNADESYELPMPGTFVVSPDKTIQLAFVDADYTRRLESEEILASLRNLEMATFK
jgi:peroxiredoxin